MSEIRHCVVFSLDDRYFALPLSAVERIARAAAITPLPSKLDLVMGVINLQGRILPVIDIRKRFSMPEKSLNADHHFIVGKTHDKQVAILVDSVLDITEIPENELVNRTEIFSSIPFISGIIKQQEDMVLVHDLDELLSTTDLEKIEKAINSLNKKASRKTQTTSGKK
jgi:purine-binding chemotaxis protein CheW